MDGHDNDENANNTGSTQGGIFSTPDLTVNAENIAQPTQDGKSSEQKRVASIFANTDTGRQAQRLNDAMEAQTAPVADDVVINNGPRTKSKLPIILLMIVLVGAVIGIVVWMVMRNVSPSAPAAPRTAKEAFAEYISYIQTGPEGLQDRVGPGNWLVFGLNDTYIFSNTERTQVFNETLKKYTTYYDKIKNSENTTLKNASEEYQKLLTLLLFAVDQTDAVQMLLNEYVESGASGAYNYVSSLTEPDEAEVNYIIIEMSANLNQYLLAQLSMVEIYDKQGCIKDKQLDNTCAAGVSEQNSAITESVQQQTSASQWIEQILPDFEATFRTNTDALKTLVEGDSNE